MIRRVFLSTMLTTVSLTAAPVHAEGDEPEIPETVPTVDEVPPLRVTIAPVVWFPRFTGDASLGPDTTSASLDFKTDLDLRGQGTVFTGDLVFQVKNDWRIHVDGFHFGTDGQRTYGAPPTNWGNLALNVGDPISTSLEMTSLEFDVAYALIQSEHNEPGRNFMEVSPAFGLRWVDISQSINQVEGSGTWVGLMFGLNLNFGFTPKTGTAWPFHRLEVDAHLSGGPPLGSTGGFMVQIRAGISVWATDNIGIVGGFRLVYVSATDNQYSFDGSVQGMYAGAIFRF